jgi:uncharacterized protein (AIM24 family)
MAEKRDLGRHRKRYTIRFGLTGQERKAFTEDISTTGLFIKTAYVHGPGSVIRVELELDERRTVVMEARVVWAKRVQPQMLHLVRKCGMGVRIVRFLSGGEDYRLLCEELALPYAELL